MSERETERRLQIFVSHKAKDADVARNFVRIIDRNSSRFKFFLSEQIEKGERYRDVICETLTSSSFLILLFLDPRDDWGWCLYETGYFDALSRVPGAVPRKIYCLHPDQPTAGPPDPINDLQPIPSRQEEVEQWLHGLFDIAREEKQVHVEDISHTAEQICQLFEKTRTELYSAGKIHITIKDKPNVKLDSLPGDTEISGDKEIVRDVFQSLAEKVFWRDLPKWLDRNPNTRYPNNVAIQAISKAVYCLSKQIPIQPLQAVIFAGQGPRRYRPVLHRVDEFGTGHLQCELLFVEDVGGQLQNVDRPLAALLTAIRIAIRVRWEILKPFVTKIAILSTLDSKKLREDLQVCLNNIFTEAESRGSYNKVDLASAFDEERSRNALCEIIDRFSSAYSNLWSAIGFNNIEFTSGEVSAEPLSREVCEEIERSLFEMEAANADFLVMSTVRVRDFISDELKVRFGKKTTKRPPRS